MIVDTNVVHIPTSQQKQVFVQNGLKNTSDQPDTKPTERETALVHKLANTESRANVANVLEILSMSPLMEGQQKIVQQFWQGM